MAFDPPPPLDDARCPHCGAVLPEQAPQGLCPRCLFAGLAAQTEDAAGAASQVPPPMPEELRPHFPQLEILECLGRGGMGVVYKARQKSLNRFVALKLLAPERVNDPAFAERFSHEAQALARLSHPNIVTIHDFGQAGGFYYLLMEFVDGVNLRQAMRAGRFTPEQALAIVPPVCEALQYAHDHGIVHRDIKPENLLLDKEGRVKIADFGIAKIMGESGTAVPAVSDTITGGTPVPLSMPAGTPQYMAPEQREHRRTDHRADIYSLGVVLYELLTGELPADKLQPPSRKVQIDVRLDEIVLRALENEPELRYQTAADFRTQVEAAVAPVSPLVAEDASPEWEKRGRMAVGAILLLLIGVWFALQFLILARAWIAGASGLVALGVLIFVWVAGLRVLWKKLSQSSVASGLPRWISVFAAMPVQARGWLLAVLVVGGLLGTAGFCGFRRNITGPVIGIAEWAEYSREKPGDWVEHWHYGLLGSPWFVQENTHRSSGGQNSDNRLKLASGSFGVGIWTALVWALVLLGMGAEAKARLPRERCVFLWHAFTTRDGKARIRWRRFGAALMVAAAMMCVAMCFTAAAMRLLIGDTGPPILMMLMGIPMMLGPLLALLGKSAQIPRKPRSAAERQKVWKRFALIALTFALLLLCAYPVSRRLQRTRPAPLPATKIMTIPQEIVGGFQRTRQIILSRSDADADGCLFFKMTPGESIRPPFRLTMKPGNAYFAEFTSELEKWIAEHDVDILFKITDAGWQMMTLEMQADFAAQPLMWESVTPEQLRAVFRSKDARGLVRDKVPIARRGGYSSGFSSVDAFRTRRDAIGAYQIRGDIESDSGVKGIRLRWKLVDDAAEAAGQPPVVK